MSYIRKIFKNPLWPAEALLRRYGKFIKNDETYLRWYYYLNIHKKLNLNNPQTYNEKINWLKLYDHNPLYTMLVDKLRVKDYVAGKIGSEHIIKTIGVWGTVDEIDWDKLPNRFVLKTNHGGGNVGVIICRDKSCFDICQAKKKLDMALKQNLYLSSREWPYKNIKPMILAEEYMEDEYGELRDYKFLSFNGKVRALFVATERQKRAEPYFNFFDDKYIPLPFKQEHPANPIVPAKPKSFEEMIKIAEVLSKGIPHVRIDLYDINGKVFFGEYTFYHFAGTRRFEPEEWDYKLGEWIELPNGNSTN